MYGEGTVTDEMCLAQFAKFRARDFLLDNAPWSGRPVEVDSDQIKTLIENNQCYTMSEIANILKISKSSVESICTSLVMLITLVFGFHISLAKQKTFLTICAQVILYWNIMKTFSLKQIVMGDEKWILYNNVEWKWFWGNQNESSPTTPNASLHPKKVMLCIWSGWQGILYYELFLENQTIHSNKYCTRLDQLKAALKQKMHNLPSG